MKILSIVGARPQFVKASVLRRVFDADPDTHEVLVHTGQHYDAGMSDVFFDELSIRAPEHNLDIHGGGHGQMTGRMLEGLERVMQEENPDVVLVYGDTNSTLAGALAAAKLHIPVAHVEAGLRSFNRAMPEEVNRVLTDHVSTWLFSPTQAGIDNLKAEGITDGVHHVGDLMYDATLAAKAKVEGRTEVAGIDLGDCPIATCTLHRAENTDDPDRLSRILDFLNAQAEGRRIILPLHPRTRNALQTHGLDTGAIQTIDPVGYLDMQTLLANSEIVFTDSGGLQKEAYFHGVPCVTLRDETEWVELIDCGWNRLWTQDSYAARKPVTEYGEGMSGERIRDILKS